MTFNSIRKLIHPKNAFGCGVLISLILGSSSLFAQNVSDPNSSGGPVSPESDTNVTDKGPPDKKPPDNKAIDNKSDVSKTPDNKTPDNKVPNNKEPDNKVTDKKVLPEPKTQPESTSEIKKPPADNVPHGQELVSIDFPNGVNLGDIIKTVGIWSGRNFILAQGVAGSTRISIISPEPVTKEEAYQAFLSALNISGFTTVDTGSVIKILPIANAKSSNIKTYYGENWAPATDELINQVVPLHYIDANAVINQLRPLLGVTQYAAFTITNSLILTDTGNRIRKILEVIKLLDAKTNQPQVYIEPVHYMDAKDAAAKLNGIFGAANGSTSLSLQKIFVDEHTNSILLVGPGKGLDDVVRFLRRFDVPAVDQSSQSTIRVRSLDYASAEKLAQTLQALAQNSNANKGNTPGFRPNYPNFPNSPNSPQPAKEDTTADLGGVKITADIPTNSLIIQSSKAAYEELNKIITQLDRRRAQVYIEANILDMQATDQLTWTPAALGGVQTSGGRYTIPFGFNIPQALPFTYTPSGTPSPGALAGLGPTAALGILSGQTITIAGLTLSPGALILALKQNANTNVLQTPSMIVADNAEAKFDSDNQWNYSIPIPNPNGVGTVFNQIKYDVVTQLKVKPQVSRADFVNMDITLQLDTAGPPDPVNGYPNPIVKRDATTTVTVQNGQTVVLGGITVDSTKRTEAKVPLLGDIPIIGWLFKAINNQKEKAILTLFLTPHVIRESEDLEKIYEQKIKDRDEFLRFLFGKNFKKEPFYAELPDADAGKAPPPRPDSSSEDDIENNGGPQSEGSKLNKNSKLPSEESNPIIAPTAGSGGGSGFSQPNFPTPPPPPPPPSPPSLP